MNRIKRLLRPAVLGARYLRHACAPRESYAADFEDVAATLLLGRIGRFVDVGANDGFTGSNSLLFALRGAGGLCFEPDPENFARLAALFRFNRRVECVPEALSAQAGEMELRCDGVLSTLAGNEDPALEVLLAGHRRSDAPTVRVPLSPLSRHLSARPEFATTDVISIDVEGHELAVLEGIDWTATPVPARIFVIETHAHGDGADWRHRDFAAIDTLLSARGYRAVAESRNNTFWLHGSAEAPERVRAARQALPSYRWRDA